MIPPAQRTTLGRRHSEPFDEARDPFELDRSRILHSAAFRRLEYKTQVFVTHTDDHFRTRLTHTLEVAAIARELAQRLCLNATLAETIALAHDLGHPPFGHAGEQALAELMADAGGFEHNNQSLRVVDYLEHPYPQFRGLNLTFETREGLVKHFTTYDKPQVGLLPADVQEEFAGTGRWPTLEGQIACISDRLAYDAHDLEDAIGASLIDERDLNGVELWRAAAEEIRRSLPDAPLPAVRRPILDGLGEMLLVDAVTETKRRSGEFNIHSADEVRNAPVGLVGLSNEMTGRLEELERFLFKNVYRSPRVVGMDTDARVLIKRLFETYCRTPIMLPARFQDRLAGQGVKRVVCDYLAGMTDRFCRDDHQRLCGAL